MLKEKYDIRDYLFWWENTSYIEKENKYKYLQEFNQKRLKKYNRCCTIFWWLASLWYNNWILFTQEEIEKACDKAIKDWIVWDDWAYFIDAVKFIQKYMNEYYKKDYIYYRLEVNSEEFLEWLQNWRSFMMWYYSSKELVQDTEKDWIADLKTYPKNSWHLAYFISKEWDEYVINSYKWHLKYNQFRFKYFDDLVNELFIMKYVYILFDKKYTMQLPKHLDPKILQWQWEWQDIVLEWERIVNKAIKEWYKLVYKKYDWEYWIQKMLIEIYNIRKEYWINF
jgi:adenylate kinase family enzyme